MPEIMKLTRNQERVIDELRKIGRESLFRYRESSPYLYQLDCEKVSKGDQYCVFGLGGLTYQVGAKIGLGAGAVLSIFKALRRKGLVIREENSPDYRRPRYWWPIGLASELAVELIPATSEGDAVSGCAYEIGDWQCREGGYLWYAGDGEGWDPEDCTHICPHCRTKDYLEAAKEDAESCSSYSNNGDSGTGLDIWTAAEKTALTANHPAACKALSEIGAVSALDGDDSAAGYSVVLCNTQQVTP